MYNFADFADYRLACHLNNKVGFYDIIIIIFSFILTIIVVFVVKLFILKVVFFFVIVIFFYCRKYRQDSYVNAIIFEIFNYKIWRRF